MSRSRLSVGTDRVEHLGDLVTLEKVRVVVVFTVESGGVRDIATQSESDHHSVLNRHLVDDGQRARHSEADRAVHRVGRRGTIVGSTTAEHLAVCT